MCDQLSSIVRKMIQDTRNEASSVPPSPYFDLPPGKAPSDCNRTFEASSSVPLGWSLAGSPSDKAEAKDLVSVKDGQDGTIQRCSAWCSCICHTRNSFRSPWYLKHIFGEVDIHYGTRRPTCNEFKCRGPVISSLDLTYQLPRYLMSRYMAVKIQCAQLDGPQISLRMPRVMKWSHLLWNYAGIGNTLAIQKMFSEGKASPYDMNPHGSNALTYAARHNNTNLG